jgi:hypothetical protein
MSASPAHYLKPATRCVAVLTPLIRHVNTGTLAFVMFVALALLSATHGKDSETRESTPLKATKTEVAIDNLHFRDRESPKRLAHN